MSSKLLKISDRSPAGNPKPDVKAIMAEIRARVMKELEENPILRDEFESYRVDTKRGDRKAGELINCEELKYLNRLHAYSSKEHQLSLITSHRGGIGKIIVWAKRKLFSFFADHVFVHYFQAEREYQANLASFLNRMSSYVDARDAFVFWELIRKIDYDINKALERIERVADDGAGSLRATERRLFDSLNESLESMKRYVTELQASSAQHSAKLATLDSVASGLERIVAGLARPQIAARQELQQILASDSDSAKDGALATDYSYLLLENRYRGSEEEIKQRISFYGDIFLKSSQPVVEIGPGRGELLQVFAERGIKAYGVELDHAMVLRSREKGLDVREGDGIAHLKALPDRSISGVIATQVIEHLTQAQLKDLLAACKAKVSPGGRVIFETINSESIIALAHHYFRDPTHVAPLHPDTMKFVMEMAGFKVLEVRKLSPFDDGAQFKLIPTEDYMTPRWVETVGRINQNFEQLNTLLFGHQDYCIIAEV